ncbi:MAG: phosphoglycerate kinase [Candidatus Asgardarchaeum californiense]|nr:MAG: phosphoglycerate kinase [Candidatus Asgardarchaeum californiense]
MKEYNTLDDFNLENKTVLLRADFNLPLDKNTLDILDTTRIKLVLPTISELMEKHAKIVILAHQGRQGSWDFTSLEKHAKALEKLLGRKVMFVDDVYGEVAKNTIKNLQYGEILMLDNVRKFSGETDKKSASEHAQSELVQSLYPLADLFVNDAFAAAHRGHCSLIGFTAVLPSCAGRLMEKELTTLEKVVKNPEKPSVFVFGGAKFSDVIITIQRILENRTADEVLLTGLPANAFLKTKGYVLGIKNENALLDEGTSEQFEQIKRTLNQYKKSIHLPVDFAISENETRKEINLEDLPSDFNLFDIGEKTIEKFKKILLGAKTVFLSGPCGVFENPLFRKGTEEIFTFVANSDAFSIVGGGHTVAAIKQMGIRDRISHISTGGGSLEKFMMGEKLIVVEALKSAKNSKIQLRQH